MGFYEQISKYYDYIFPVSGQHLKFIEEAAGASGRRVLDVACGSGGYAVELARKGYRVTAVDLEGEMVDMARAKADAAGVELEALGCDMRKLEEVVHDSFDCIFCIGNSIVHLGSMEDIKKALEQMNSLLNEDGVLVLQIINYDRIIKNGLNELPTIKNPEVGLEFIRKYEYISDTAAINFNTVLTVGSERYENTVELLPVMSGNMKKALEDAGFNSIQFFGDFNKGPYNDEAYMLVVKAEKNLAAGRC